MFSLVFAKHSFASVFHDTVNFMTFVLLSWCPANKTTALKTTAFQIYKLSVVVLMSSRFNLMAAVRRKRPFVAFVRKRIFAVCEGS